MSKNTVYLVEFGVLYVLSGVLVGTGIAHADNRFEMLISKLNLSIEQKTKITEILENTRQEIEALGKNVRSAFSEIKEKTDKQIMDILTFQQQETFKALQKRSEKSCGPEVPEEEQEPMRGR